MKTYLLTFAMAAALAGCAKKEDEVQPLSAASQTANATTSDPFGVIHSTPFFMQNDFWNKGASGAGSQSCFFNNRDDWGANATHSYGSGQIKSYPSLVYGQHYGTKSDGWRLPQKIQDLGTVHSYWSQTSKSSSYDAAYDVWFDTASAPAQDAQDELMIWVDWSNTKPLAQGYNASGAIPYATSVLLDGRHWNVYHTLHGRGDVMSFLPVSGGGNSMTVNMKPLINYCVSKGWLQTSEYMTSIQAGWEIIAGGSFRTTAFNIDGGTL